MLCRKHVTRLITMQYYLSVTGKTCNENVLPTVIAFCGMLICSWLQILDVPFFSLKKEPNVTVQCSKYLQVTL